MCDNIAANLCPSHGCLDQSYTIKNKAVQLLSAWLFCYSFTFADFANMKSAPKYINAVELNGTTSVHSSYLKKKKVLFLAILGMHTKCKCKSETCKGYSCEAY